jgi:hypothetical protein
MVRDDNSPSSNSITKSDMMLSSPQAAGFDEVAVSGKREEWCMCDEVVKFKQNSFCPTSGPCCLIALILAMLLG